MEDIPINTIRNHPDCDVPFKLTEKHIFITYNFNNSFKPDLSMA
jgi:hypothetical protein